jgi:hypothetical protein
MLTKVRLPPEVRRTTVMRRTTEVRLLPENLPLTTGTEYLSIP